MVESAIFVLGYCFR